jgi:hypothetical protein
MRKSSMPSRSITATVSNATRRPRDLTEATKWHLISRAGGETDLELDDVINKLDPQTRTAGEKAAKPWLDAIEAVRKAQAAAQQAQPSQATPAK